MGSIGTNLHTTLRIVKFFLTMFMMAHFSACVFMAITIYYRQDMKPMKEVEMAGLVTEDHFVGPLLNGTFTSNSTTWPTMTPTQPPGPPGPPGPPPSNRMMMDHSPHEGKDKVAPSLTKPFSEMPWHNESWIVRNDFAGYERGYTYLVTLYWAFTTLTTVGYGDVTARLPLEIGWTIFVMLCGTSLFGYIIGSCSALITKEDQTSEMIKAKMNSVNSYMRYRGISKSLANKISRFYEKSWKQTQVYNEEEILAELPKTIRTEVALHIFQRPMMDIPFFRNIDDDLFPILALKLKPLLVSRRDLVIKEGYFGDEMFFVTNGELKAFVYGGLVGAEEGRLEALAVSQKNISNFLSKEKAQEGIVQRNLEIWAKKIKKPDSFADYAIMMDCPKHPLSVRAITECDLFTLSKKSFGDICQIAPRIFSQLAPVTRQNYVKLMEFVNDKRVCGMRAYQQGMPLHTIEKDETIHDNHQKERSEGIFDRFNRRQSIQRKMKKMKNMREMTMKSPSSRSLLTQTSTSSNLFQKTTKRSLKRVVVAQSSNSKEARSSVPKLGLEQKEATSFRGIKIIDSLEERANLDVEKGRQTHHCQKSLQEDSESIEVAPTHKISGGHSPLSATLQNDKCIKGFDQLLTRAYGPCGLPIHLITKVRAWADRAKTRVALQSMKSIEAQFTQRSARPGNTYQVTEYTEKKIAEVIKKQESVDKRMSRLEQKIDETNASLSEISFLLKKLVQTDEMVESSTVSSTSLENFMNELDH